MNDSTTVQIIKDTLSAMGVSYETVHTEETAGQRVFRIETSESKKLIGSRGETLKTLDFIVKKLLEKQGVEKPHFMIDIDGYRSKHIEELQQKARMLAERARSFEYDVEMTPMSAYERLIVHATLADTPSIKTESQGEGRERRIVIKFVSNQ